MISYWVYKIRWYISIAIMLCGFIAVTKFFSWGDRALGFSTAASVSPRVSSSTASTQQTPDSLSVAPAVSAADIDIQLTQAKKLLDEAAEFQVSAFNAAIAWQSDIESFRETPASKSLPIDSELGGQQRLFEQMAYVANSERMSIENLAKVASRIEIAKSKAESASNQSSPTSLQVDELAEILELHSISKQASRAWTLALQQASAIKHRLESQFMNDATEHEPTFTVGDKIADAAAKATLDDLDEQIEREAANKLLERAQAEEAQAFAREATKPEVISLLAPFLEHRYVQPREMAGTTLRFKKTVDKLPISFSALVGINALAESEAGLSRLATLGGHWELSEPKWAVKSQAKYWSEDDREMLKKAQEFLRTYGPTLVQEGLLAP